MKRFLLLHVGFQMPTPDLMAAWMAWFETIAPHQLDQGGFKMGREISQGGAHDLPWDAGALTGYNIIQAKSFDEAEALARTCPFVTSIQVYELR